MKAYPRRLAMKLKPLHDWAVIIPSEAAAVTAGGLYIPDTAKEKPEEGIVEAIGPGAYEEEKRGRKKEENQERKFIPSVVRPGERVLYERWAGKTYTIGTDERILVRERDVLGLIDRPLIPAKTTTTASTALVARSAAALPAKREEGLAGTSVKAKPKKAAAKSPAKKGPKKAGKKKIVKKAVKKKSGPGAKPKGKKPGKKK
jgi:chaperonin GroES